MNWHQFNTNDLSPDKAFETLCNQLFNIWIKKKKEGLKKFRVINGSGGDGGIESYAVLNDGTVLGLQAKWFKATIGDSQIRQIRNSIDMAMKVRSHINRYIICIPRDLGSLRIVRGGDVSQNTEEARIEKLINKMKIKYSTLEIEVWGDHELNNLLLEEEAKGVKRYWFEDKTITIEDIRFSFEKQKRSWLDKKYLPDLHLKSEIEENIKLFIKEETLIEKLTRKIAYIKDVYNEILAAMILLDKTLSLEKYVQLKDQAEYLKNQIIILSDLSETLDIFLLKINNNDYNFLIITAEYNIHNLDYILSIKKTNKLYFHLNRLEKALNKMIDFNFINLEFIVSKLKYSGLRICLGEPGIGKTQTIGKIIDEMLEKNDDIPILIRAKNVSNNQSWKDIICQSLGINTNWNEAELLQYLEAFAFKSQTSALVNQKKTLGNIVVFIDGLDECKPNNIWIEKIKEAEVINEKHSRIKFCFTSRPNVFTTEDFANIPQSFIERFSSKNTVSLKSLFNHYTVRYNINIGNAIWLKNAFNTPLSIRLFCENYANSDVSKIQSTEILMTSLISKRIENIEKEFLLDNGDVLSYRREYIKPILLKISELFIYENYNDYEIIVDKIKEIPYIIDDQIINKSLDLLESYGFLSSVVINPRTFFEKTITRFNIGMEPLFDYLFSLKLYNEDTLGNLHKYKDFLKEKPNVLLNLSILSLQQQKYFIPLEEKVIENLDLDEHTKIWLIANTLTNVTEEVSADYKNTILKFMMKNAEYLKLIVSNLILELVHQPKHILGANLLNEYLLQFDNAMVRDLYWSIPSNLGNVFEHTFASSFDITLPPLDDENNDSSLPILYAWRLSTIDNRTKVDVKKELLKWGIKNPKYFIGLLKSVLKTNDPQMLQELFSIAFCVVLNHKSNREVVCKIADQLKDRLFDDNKDLKEFNSALRYFTFEIFKYAKNLGSHQKEYEISFPMKCLKDLKLDRNATLNGTRMGGYEHIISYDLSRYVLIDPIMRNFFGRYTENPESYILKNNFMSDGEFLKIKAQELKLENINPENFILGAAFQYLIDNGWNVQEFDGKSSADRFISSRYRPTTHGSKSSVMTIVEKYIWSAKNEINGYLSENLYFCSDYNKKVILEDYNLVADYSLDFEITNSIYSNLFYPNEIYQEIDGEVNESILKNWILKDVDFPLDDWVEIANLDDNSYMCLSGYHQIPVGYYGDVILWINSFLIKDENTETLIGIVENDLKSLEPLVSDIEYLEASLEDKVYHSSREIILNDSLKEYQEMETINTQNEKLNLYKTTLKAVEFLIEDDSELYYKLPSAIIRKHLEIQDGDLSSFLSSGKNIGKYFISGEKWHSRQEMLLVSKDYFLNKIQPEKYNICWIVRVMREGSNQAREVFEKLVTQKNDFYLMVYNENEIMKYKIKSECFI